MKKSLILLASLLTLSAFPVFAEDNPNQAEIDTLLAELEGIQKEAQAIKEKMLEELKPLGEKESEINKKLKELGYTQHKYETQNAIYDIKEMKIVDNSMFPEKKALILVMEFTNKGQQASSPWMTFAVDFGAQQNLGSTSQLLMGANGQLGNVEDQEAVKMGDANVNPGSTVSAIIGFDLADPSLPVQFVLNSSKLTGNPQGFTFEP